MNLTAAVDERNGVTLVELEVENPTRTTRRVRVRNELDGELLPPRRHGSVVDGFDDDGITLTIAAGTRQAVGYACRAGADSPPATIVGSEPCDSQDLEQRTAGDVQAALGDARPPRDAVTPEIRPPASRNTAAEGNEQTGETQTEPFDLADVPAAGPDAENLQPTVQEETSPDSTAIDEEGAREEAPDQGASGHPQQAPPAVDAWLTRASERIEAGQPVDQASLRAVAERADSLVSRARR